MKKWYLLLVTAMVANQLVFAQNENLGAFMDAHKADPGFMHAFLSKDAFEVAAHSDISEADWKKAQQVVKNIGTLQVLVGDSISNGMELYREARQIIPEDEYDELLTVRDGNEHIRIWIKDDGDAISEVILLVAEPSEFVLICFAGILELKNITSLAALFDAAEAKDLARTSAAVSIDFTIAPNPNVGAFDVSYTDLKDTPERITIIDQSGKIVASLPSTGTTQHVSVPDLAAGHYWVQLKTKSGKVGVKAIEILNRP